MFYLLPRLSQSLQFKLAMSPTNSIQQIQASDTVVTRTQIFKVTPVPKNAVVEEREGEEKKKKKKKGRKRKKERKYEGKKDRQKERTKSQLTSFSNIKASNSTSSHIFFVIQSLLKSSRFSHGQSILQVMAGSRPFCPILNKRNKRGERIKRTTKAESKRSKFYVL